MEEEQLPKFRIDAVLDSLSKTSLFGPSWQMDPKYLTDNPEENRRRVMDPEYAIFGSIYNM